jgi:multidrug efflux pump subunit AcrA (membrane-fusion protein)
MSRKLASLYALLSTVLATVMVAGTSMAFGLFSGGEPLAEADAVATPPVAPVTLDTTAAYQAALTDVEAQRTAALGEALAQVAAQRLALQAQAASEVARQRDAAMAALQADLAARSSSTNGGTLGAR